MMNNRMNQVVQYCLQEYVGGETFFEHLDAILSQDQELVRMMLDHVIEKESFDYLIGSGKFGQSLKLVVEQYFPSYQASVILVNGGLRFLETSFTFDKEYNLKDKKVIFLDDSYYSGRTKKRIQEELALHGATLLKTFVFYDGSYQKESQVHSIYRYYDHF